MAASRFSLTARATQPSWRAAARVAATGCRAAGHSRLGPRGAVAWSLLILRASTYVTRDAVRTGASRSSHRNSEEPSMVVSLCYLRQNRVQQELAERFGVSQATISQNVGQYTPILEQLVNERVPSRGPVSPGPTDHRRVGAPARCSRVVTSPLKSCLITRALRLRASVVIVRRVRGLGPAG